MKFNQAATLGYHNSYIFKVHFNLTIHTKTRRVCVCVCWSLFLTYSRYLQRVREARDDVTF